MRVISILTAVSALAVSGAAHAATFAGQSVDIRDAAAVVHVIPEDRADIAVESTPGAHLAAPSVRLEGHDVVIDGALRISDCGSTLGGHEPTARVAGVGVVRRSEMPVVTIHTPRHVQLATHGAVFADVGASNGGALAFGGCGDSRVGAVSGDLDVALQGSGDVDVGSVSGALHAALQGSGDLRGTEAASAQVALQGSGDVSLETVRSGPLEASLAGSGDVRVASVQGGEVSLRLAGSGDLAVQHGAADRLNAELAGSGDIAFGGHVGVLSARLSGSGDLRVASADRVETMRNGGSGDVSVGN